MIPGFLQVTISGWVRAGGALGVFMVIYFSNPAGLVATPSTTTMIKQTVGLSRTLEAVQLAKAKIIAVGQAGRDLARISYKLRASIGAEGKVRSESSQRSFDCPQELKEGVYEFYQ